MAWMDLEGIMLSEMYQSEKDKYLMILCVESKEQNKWTNKIETDSDTKKRLMVARGEGVGDLGEKCKGLKKYTLEVTK